MFNPQTKRLGEQNRRRLLLAEDDPAEQYADAQGKQGGDPHPTDSAHHATAHHPAAQGGPSHHPATEEQE